MFTIEAIIFSLMELLIESAVVMKSFAVEIPAFCSLILRVANGRCVVEVKVLVCG